MNGVWPPCLFLVFSNARHGDDDALTRWYMEVHGPDAFKSPAFWALHRYQAIGEYDARFLAVWECAFSSLEEARSQIVPRSAGLRDKSRITDDLIVIWSSMNFLTGEPVSMDPRPAAPGAVDPVPAATVTLVEGGYFEEPAANTYRYGGIVLYESPECSGIRCPGVVRPRQGGRRPSRALPKRVRPPRDVASGRRGGG